MTRNVADPCPACRHALLVAHCDSTGCDELRCTACKSIFTRDGLHTYTPPPKEPAQ